MTPIPGSDPDAPLHLIIQLPDGAMERRRVPGSQVVVGRDPSCEVVAPAATCWRVSRFHLRLERLADGWWAEDLASTNGSFVGSARLLGRRRLLPGDRLRLADHFRSGGFVFSVDFSEDAFANPS